MEPLGHVAIGRWHLGDLREHVALPVRAVGLRARFGLELLGALAHRGLLVGAEAPCWRRSSSCRSCRSPWCEIRCSDLMLRSPAGGGFSEPARFVAFRVGPAPQPARSSTWAQSRQMRPAVRRLPTGMVWRSRGATATPQATARPPSSSRSTTCQTWSGPARTSRTSPASSITRPSCRDGAPRDGAGDLDSIGPARFPPRRPDVDQAQRPPATAQRRCGRERGARRRRRRAGAIGGGGGGAARRRRSASRSPRGSRHSATPGRFPSSTRRA